MGHPSIMIDPISQSQDMGYPAVRGEWGFWV
jgi:hypothetical protein